MTPTYFEILERFENGKPIRKDDWDFEYILMTTRKLVKKYDLKWDKEIIVTNDNFLADRVFQAGFELAEQVGIYNFNSGKAFRFSKEELQQGLENASRPIIMGEGNDARLIRPRSILDPEPPLVWAGNPGAPTPEELFTPMVMSWAQEPIVDLITCGSMTHVDGHMMQAGGPLEIAVTRRELIYLRSALRQVGRPGMGMLAAQSSVSELGDLSVANPEFLRPCDSHLIPMLNELMIDRVSILRVMNSLDYGMHNASLPTVMVGGLAGDAPGAAVVQTAAFILANLVCKATYHLLHPIHIRHVATSTRGVMWVQNIVQQAFARNAPCVIFSDIYPKSGAMTKELLYETAANAIVVTVSGGHLEGVGSADGAAPNCSGLEARLMGEVGQAVTKQNLNLEEANHLVLQLLAKYEHVFNLPGGNPGLPFDQVYDLKTLQPTPEWDKMYIQVKKDLIDLGLEMY
ncbi:MAG: monomethylamine:corrinoid methyltransferase [Anaerolineaceae bacterium]|nr:monomethylamine:corrinoid methyltransferase [Anaerolineaceae bacterium]